MSVVPVSCLGYPKDKGGAYEGAESMALDLLQRDRLCARQVRSLFELLPKTSQEAGSSSVALGAYCKGGKEGLWEATKHFPKATEALARSAQQAGFQVFSHHDVQGYQNSDASRFPECTFSQPSDSDRGFRGG